MKIAVQLYFQKNPVPKSVYYCDKHPNMPVEFFCADTNKMFCNDCWHEYKDRKFERMSQRMITQRAIDLIKELELREKFLRECRVNVSKIVKKEILAGDIIQKHFDTAKRYLLGDVSQETKNCIEKIDMTQKYYKKLDSLIIKSQYVQI